MPAHPTLRRLSWDEEKRLRYLTSKAVPLKQIAVEFNMSTGWVCMQRKAIMGKGNGKNLSLPKGNRADAVLMLLSEDDIERLREAAEVRGTTIAGLGAAIMKTLADQPSLIDAVLDDDEIEGEQ